MKKIKLILFLSICLFVFSVPVIGQAETKAISDSSPSLGNAFSSGWLGKTAGEAGYNTSSATVEGIIGRTLTAIFSLLGVIFISLLIYGGFLWMTDRGNEEQVAKAKKLITASVIGLIIVLASYAISYFIINNFSKTL